jgi:hypothetical protein
VIFCFSAPTLLEVENGTALRMPVPVNEKQMKSKKIRILFLSANPWTTARILVDEEAREVFEKLQEGSYRNRFILHKHFAIRPADIQRLLMMHRPHIVHFSGHGSKRHRIILGGLPGRGKQIEPQPLVDVFALYRKHVQLVFLNACFTRTQAKSLSQVIDYSIGAGKPIGDKEGVAFAGAFYRGLAFGYSVKEAFASATAELELRRMKRARGLELFIRDGVSDEDQFPHPAAGVVKHLAKPSLINSQSFAREPEILRYGSMVLQRMNFDPIHLLERSGLRRAGKVMADEQQLCCSYEYASQLFVNSKANTGGSSPQLAAVGTVTWEHRAVTRHPQPKVQRTRQADVRKRVPRKPPRKTRKPRRSD